MFGNAGTLDKGKPSAEFSDEYSLEIHQQGLDCTDDFLVVYLSHMILTTLWTIPQFIEQVLYLHLPMLRRLSVDAEIYIQYHALPHTSGEPGEWKRHSDGLVFPEEQGGDTIMNTVNKGSHHLLLTCT